jgi:hypothetical protein
VEAGESVQFIVAGSNANCEPVISPGNCIKAGVLLLGLVGISKLVESLNKEILDDADPVMPTLSVAKIKILELADDGVILAVRPVSVKVVEVVDAVVVRVAVTTCKTFPPAAGVAHSGAVAPLFTVRT